MLTLRTSTSEQALRDQLEPLRKRRFPSDPLQLRSVQSYFADNYADELRLARILGAASLTAIAIAAFGMYGYLELLARQAEYAQQISNLSNLRVAQEAGRTDHQRRLSDLEFTLQQAEKTHARNARLAAQGFISSVGLEESADKLAQQRRAFRQERDASDTETQVRRDALTQMETAIKGLQSGLLLVNATVAIAIATRLASPSSLARRRSSV